MSAIVALSCISGLDKRDHGHNQTGVVARTGLKTWLLVKTFCSNYDKHIV
jgi:hypothetical protein